VSSTLARGLSPVRAVLDNGAVVIVQETSMAPAVTINACFLAGALYDPADRPGLSYLASKVLDHGTERRTGDLIAEELDDRGVVLKVSSSRHTLTLVATCLVQDFEDVFAIVADVARRPIFAEAEIQRRRAEAINALRQDEDNPASRAVDSLFELLYGPSHPYGRPAKGRVAGLEKITRADLMAFHARHVQASTLSLVVVGDISPSEVMRHAAVELGDWQGTPAGAVIVPPPPAPSRRLLNIPMPGKSQAEIAYGFATISRFDSRFYAYWVMNNILGQFGLGGRLADNIRERQGMAYYAFSTFDPAVGEAPLVVRAGVDPHNVDRALQAIDTEVRQLGEDGPTELELEETREYLIGSIPRMFETNPDIASFLQRAEHFNLGLDYDQRLPAYLQAVTMQDVRAAASEALHPARAAVAIASPPQSAVDS
jgi:zinc protease